MPWIPQILAVLQFAIDTCGHGGYWGHLFEGAVSFSSAICHILSTWYEKAFEKNPEGKEGEKKGKRNKVKTFHLIV